MQYLIPHKYLLYFLACFLFIGCHRGCTVSKTVRSKSRVEKIGNEKIKLLAKLKKSKRVRLNKYSKKWESSRSWYSVVIEARSDTQSLGLHWVFPEEKTANLKAYLERVNFKASPGNGYFVIDYQNSPEFTVVFQQLGDAFIESPYQSQYLAGTALNQLPTAEQLVEDFLFNNLKVSRQTTLLRYMKTHPLSEDQYIALFDKLTQVGNPIAKNYFKSINICQLEKYVQFREHAINKALAVMEENRLIMSDWDIYEKVLLCLATEDELRKADKLAFKAFEGRRGDKYQDYIQERLKDQNIPVTANLIQQTLGKAQQSVQYELSGSQKYLRDRMPFEESVAFLASIKKEQKLVDEAVDFMLNNDSRGYNRYERFLDNQYEYFSTTSQQKFILYMKKRFDEEMTGTSSIKQADYYNYLNGRIDCNDMKDLYQQYKSKNRSEVFLDKQPQC